MIWLLKKLFQKQKLMNRFFEANMLNPQLINSLFKSFPYKCDDFKHILENTNNIKVSVYGKE